METKDYKQEIINTRRGCIGSSDGTMLAQIANLGSVPRSALARLAVVKGLVEPHDGFKTKAMVLGDKMENAIFDMLQVDGSENYESNPLWVSKKYSRKNVKLISHPDIVRMDESTKTLYVYEVKTTKYSWKEARDTYKCQLFIHYMLAKEIASNLGRTWKVKLFLVVYNTDGLDIAKNDLSSIEFDASRLIVQPVRFSNVLFDIAKGMETISEFLETFTEYYGGDEVDADLLPTNIQEQFTTMANMLVEIKERESKVAQFKEYLYNFMVEKEIKSIKNDVFSITRVDPSESKATDYKAFFEFYASKYPRKARRYAVTYAKMTKKKGYAKITLKNNNND